jgi:hypothetical protein
VWWWGEERNKIKKKKEMREAWEGKKIWGVFQPSFLEGPCYVYIFLKGFLFFLGGGGVGERLPGTPNLQRRSTPPCSIPCSCTMLSSIIICSMS